MRRSRWGAAALAAPLAASLLVTPVQAAADHPKNLDSFYTQPVNWAECPAGWVTPSTGVECATVVVPLNYKKPDDGNLEIAISRKKAADPARRRGILFTNPGGPGGSGLRLVNWLNGQEAQQVYDVIGMDPRGVGRSTNLLCITTSSDDEFPTRPTEAQLSNWTDYARAQETNCQRGGGDMRRFINTMNTARDMDVIRGALGEKKLNYLGYSYGTHLGSVYGSMFPAKLDRSVLDSALDPNKTWHGSDPDVVDAIVWNFRKWTEWVAARNSTYGLGTTASAVRGEVEKIAQRLVSGPYGGYQDQSGFDNAIGPATRYRNTWASFARHVQQLKVGSADPAQTHAMTAALAKMDIEPTSPGTYYAVTCEWDWSTDVQSYYADMRRYRDNHPYGGTVEYGAPQNCTFRSFERPELIPPITRKYPTGLVINSDGDIQTPYANGQAMAEHLREPLISVSNSGIHGHYALRGNACVDKLVNKYLVSGVLPASRTTCPGTDVAENVQPGIQSEKPLAELFTEIATAEQPY
ncbi:tripeptidyl aminopeptidase [Lentzea sp. NBRC 105346]|uniref:alpha/beta fold hydrolase n=1 Tax=Lentzea sp. NBRC 105346 TaxID=3032205 RepID=UPI0024A10284|nr:alpha/beta fold hydrolase [Lentzea sp. NBRC 105346]GLZ34629.1 tripeptidyl aminopeptidase [Lentzea sp. NBRC 105346]